MRDIPNATFVCFRPSGKYYTDARGFLPERAFDPIFTHEGRRDPIVEANGDKLPGLDGPGYGYTVFVYPDANVPYGWPLMLAART